MTVSASAAAKTPQWDDGGWGGHSSGAVAAAAAAAEGAPPGRRCHRPPPLGDAGPGPTRWATQTHRQPGRQRRRSPPPRRDGDRVHSKRRSIKRSAGTGKKTYTPSSSQTPRQAGAPALLPSVPRPPPHSLQPAGHFAGPLACGPPLPPPHRHPPPSLPPVLPPSLPPSPPPPRRSPGVATTTTPGGPGTARGRPQSRLWRPQRPPQGRPRGHTRCRPRRRRP